LKLLATLLLFPAAFSFSYLTMIVGMFIGTSIKLEWDERLKEKYFRVHIILTMLSIVILTTYLSLTR
jgi:hypothetical protein